MTAEELMQLRRAEPFRPFRIVLKDGRTFDVVGPHFIMAHDWLVTVGSPASSDPDLWADDSITSFETGDVDRVEAPPEPVASAGGGA